MSNFISSKFFFTLLASAALVVSLLWAYLFLNQKSLTLLQDLNQIESKILSIEKERGSAKKSLAILKERQGDLARIESVFIKKAGAVDFVEELEILAKRTNNSFVIDLDETKSREENKLIFRMAVDGTLNSVLKYLKLLELLPYKIEIENLTLQKTDSEKTTHRLNVLLTTDAL